ncbi:carboxymuconolactone decarboxylase family protein [Yinghuangia seranimata]|nr:carboxymuconolactone decarboxylase family protein [Yinghuangia seranimata]MDI2127697.1 carboxymuconolactone decarboxylase family protein [Yinghuangia seranimata]
MRTVSGTNGPAVLDSLADIAPDLARYTAEFAYGDVYANPRLTPRQRQIATVAALAALGNATPQLRFHIDGALNVGCTRTEIVEVIVHTAVYAGFPAALNAIAAARDVFTARPDTATEAQTGTEPAASDASAAAEASGDTPSDRRARGTRALSAVDGQAGEHVIASLADIAPDLGAYIVDFVFGDVYTRPGLDLKTRELATVAACTALGTAAPQLKVHLHGFLNVGGTRDEAVETITQMAVYAGFPAALNAITVAREAFTEHA